MIALSDKVSAGTRTTTCSSTRPSRRSGPTWWYGDAASPTRSGIPSRSGRAERASGRCRSGLSVGADDRRQPFLRRSQCHPVQALATASSSRRPDHLSRSRARPLPRSATPAGQALPDLVARTATGTRSFRRGTRRVARVEAGTASTAGRADLLDRGRWSRSPCGGHGHRFDRRHRRRRRCSSCSCTRCRRRRRASRAPVRARLDRRSAGRVLAPRRR